MDKIYELFLNVKQVHVEQSLRRHQIYMGLGPENKVYIIFLLFRKYIDEKTAQSTGIEKLVFVAGGDT